MDLLIRPARKRDTNKFSEIYYSEFSKLDRNWTRQTSRARIRQAIRTYPSLCFAMELDGKIVGFVLAEHLDFAKGKYIYLADVAVSSKFQRRGLGEKALRFLFSVAKARGYKSIYLNAIRKGPVLKLYKKLGFRQTKYVHMEKALYLIEVVCS